MRWERGNEVEPPPFSFFPFPFSEIRDQIAELAVRRQDLAFLTCPDVRIRTVQIRVGGRNEDRALDHWLFVDVQRDCRIRLEVMDRVIFVRWNEFACAADCCVQARRFAEAIIGVAIFLD